MTPELKQYAHAHPLYPMLCHDGGRKESKRSKQRNDCTVRALAIATGIPYDEAYDLLAAAGRKSGSGFNIKKWAPTASVNNFGFKWIAFPAVSGQRRMNPMTFCKQYSTRTYIARVAKHVFAVIDGVIYDTHEPRADCCIYGVWEIIKL